MSRSPEPKRDESSLSPPRFEDGNGSAPIQITIHSVMAGLKDATITINADATVGRLKRIVSIISEVPVEQQILVFKDKVLSNENATLSSYGIVKACTITMNLKMNTGSKKPQSSPPNEEATKWTAAKQMENEITRNRMKKLLRKRKRLNVLSPTPSKGSVFSLSPVESQTGLKSNDKVVVLRPEVTENMQELTEKELQCFFEPPESQEELELQQSELFVPPESVEELNQVKLRRDIEFRTICKMCHQKLSLAEQEIKCLCQQVFCKKHRTPAAHLCPIDYKQTGRSKIFQENHKTSCRRTHRAPMSE